MEQPESPSEKKIFLQESEFQNSRFFVSEKKTKKMSNHILTEILIIVSGIIAISQLIYAPGEKNETGSFSIGTIQIISISVIGILTGLFGQWLSEEMFRAASEHEHDVEERASCRYSLSALLFCTLCFTGLMISSIFIFLNYRTITTSSVHLAGLESLLLSTIINTGFEIMFVISIVNFLFVDFADIYPHQTYSNSKELNL